MPNMTLSLNEVRFNSASTRPRQQAELRLKQACLPATSPCNGPRRQSLHNTGTICYELSVRNAVRCLNSTTFEQNKLRFNGRRGTIKNNSRCGTAQRRE